MQRLRSRIVTSAGGGLLLLPLLAGCATASETTAADPTQCLPSRTTTQFDVAGPGQPDPETASLRVLGGTVTSTLIDGDRATALVDSATAGLVQLQLHRAADGWWPDSFRACETGS
ncbi:hypothetical protein [uncultured Amnibacterium sp.]|uniref:hypothetical protein n=1 Tax=uncultured Amnibacterium sp. TaxID=1631851 RepID=UPI0035CABB34